MAVKYKGYHSKHSNIKDITLIQRIIIKYKSIQEGLFIVIF